MSRPTLGLGYEALSIRSRLVPFSLLGDQRGHWYLPSLCTRVSASRVDQDAVKPSPQRRSTFEAIERLERSEPGILDHLVGRSEAAYPGLRDAHKAWLITGDDPRKSTLIPVFQRVQRGSVVRVHGRRTIIEAEARAKSNTGTGNGRARHVQERRGGDQSFTSNCQRSDGTRRLNPCPRWRRV
jgi:hypothetical protein